MWDSPPGANSPSSRGPHHGHWISSIGSSSMSDAGGRRLVDEPPGAEARKREGSVQGMRLTARDRMGKDPAGARGRLESAGPPTAIDVKPFDRRQPDDRAGIGRAIDDPRPLPQHPEPAEYRKQLDQCGKLVLDDRDAAALGIGG